MQNYFTNTRDVVSHFCSHISGKTLDFGAGSAKYGALIRPHTTEYITFDMHPSPCIDVVGDVLQPPFSENTFDTVICTQVLEHVQKPWVVAAEMYRITAPNGTCIITAPFLIPFHADPHDYFRYTVQGIESLFRECGFTIVESGRYGNTAAVFSEMIHFGHMSRYRERTRLRTWCTDRARNLIRRIARFLDPHLYNNALYANVYIVVQKPATQSNVA